MALLVIFGSYTVVQLIARTTLSLAMYHSVFREGYWVVAWALASTSTYAFVLIIKPPADK